MSGPRWNRRNFLKAMLMTAAGGASFGGVSLNRLTPALSSPLSPGEADHRHRFIFCYFNGGWDTLLGLDPRDPYAFSDERRGTTLIQPAYGRLPTEFSTAGTEGNGMSVDQELGFSLGPAAQPVWKHRRDMCIVRGVSMNTVTHEVGRRYFLTGRMPSGLSARGSSIGTEIAAQLHGPSVNVPADQLPYVPNLAYAVETYNDRHPSYASALKISSTEDLLDTLTRPDFGYSDAEERLIGEFLHSPRSFRIDADQMPDMLRRARRSEVMAEAVLAAQLDRRFQFPEGMNLNSPQAIGMMAVQALTNNICTTVSIRIARGLDTHFANWSTDQPMLQREGFEIIDQILTDLKSTPYPDGSGDSWLKYTTIVAFSEFSRTPLINTRDGRDHHPVNSCAVFGAGVPGGRVIGASSDKGMLSQKVNLDNGQVDEQVGVLIRPEDILGTVMANNGLDGSILGRDVQYIPALVPRT